jgi:Cu(I)/Ag(I) efflux system membrane fusion protein
MSRIIAAIVLLAAVAAGFLAGSWHAQRERVNAASLPGPKVLYYVDPMHPAYKSDRPGIAPDCGMQLEPVYASDRKSDTRPATATGTVNIGPEQQQLLGVRVDVIHPQPVNTQLRLYGRVVPDETRVYRIDVGTDGFVRELPKVTTGSHVRQDEWLATFSAPDVRLVVQGYLVATDVLDRTKKNNEGQPAIDLAMASVQQATDRLLTLGMSPTQIAEIGRTRLVPATVRITSPADGFVLARNVSVGQKFERGDELYRIADLRRVWILVDVFGADADYIQPGMVAHVSVPGRQNRIRATVVRDVLAQFDSVTQTTKVRLDADNAGFVLRPDMAVDIALPVRLPPALTVPTGAVIDSGVRKIVYLERSEGVFEPREVETGWRFGDRVEIVSGLAAGDRVVASGTFLLDSESRLTHVAPDQRR